MNKNNTIATECLTLNLGRGLRSICRLQCGLECLLDWLELHGPEGHKNLYTCTCRTDDQPNVLSECCLPLWLGVGKCSMDSDAQSCLNQSCSKKLIEWVGWQTIYVKCFEDLYKLRFMTKNLPIFDGKNDGKFLSFPCLSTLVSCCEQTSIANACTWYGKIWCPVKFSRRH